MMRARSKDGSRVRKQRGARSVYGGKTAPRSRLNKHQKFAGALPCFVEHGFCRGLRQFAQRIRNHDQIVRLTGQAGAQVLL